MEGTLRGYAGHYGEFRSRVAANAGLWLLHRSATTAGRSSINRALACYTIIMTNYDSAQWTQEAAKGAVPGCVQCKSFYSPPPGFESQLLDIRHRNAISYHSLNGLTTTGNLREGGES